jgi:hypothetical protein
MPLFFFLSFPRERFPVEIVPRKSVFHVSPR